MALFSRHRRPPTVLRRFIRCSLSLLALGGAGLAAISGFIRGPLVLTGPERPTTAASADRLRADVERLCGEFARRNSRHPDQLAAAAAWIAAEWRATGLDVSLQRYEVDGVPHANVLARRSGSEGTGAGLVVLGAHHDAYFTTPGADDNASGVAALLELARTTQGRSFRRDQLLVAFDTEEPPFFGTRDMGSAQVAELLIARGERIEFMAALDMVGRFSDEPGSQTWPLFRGLLMGPDRGNFLAVVGDEDSGEQLRRAKRGLRSAGALPVLSLRAPTWFGWTTLSDHSSFRQRGLPGVLITDTGPLRNGDYHGAGDVPEALDYEALAGVVQSLEALLLEVDSSPGLRRPEGS